MIKTLRSLTDEEKFPVGSVIDLELRVTHNAELDKRVSFVKTGDNEIQITEGNGLLPPGYYNGNVGDVMRVAFSLYSKMHDGKRTVNMKTYLHKNS